jgi:peptidoglycan L-alanyl-D-glutamate endopeptidase CwlK
MDTITLQRIKTAHPNIREELEKQYIEANNLLGKGVRLRFAYVYRTIEEQNALFKKRPKVTNAKGGQSIHNYGLAFDIVLLYDLDNNGTFETASWNLLKDHDRDGQADWMEVVNYFKSKGWNWGGDFKGFKDSPHFEVKGYSWRELIKMERFINNGLYYPKI